MQKFMIISPHTMQECKQVVKLTLAAGYLSHFEWGCKSGDHNGYAMIEAESEQQALLSIPTVVRHKGRAIGVAEFDPKDVETWDVTHT